MGSFRAVGVCVAVAVVVGLGAGRAAGQLFPMPTYQVVSEPRSVAVGDFDLDGDIDMAMLDTDGPGKDPQDLLVFAEDT